MEVRITECKEDACETCEEMVGKVVDTDYPDHPLHVNCRCECDPVEESDNSAATIETAAVDQTINEKRIDENNEVDVQVSVVGDIIGSDANGSPIKQAINEESLSKIAETLNSENKEVLVDVDHQSEKDGLDRNTKAAGWLSKFWTSAKGLFAKLKLTPSGRALVEGKEYRKLSPVFTLDKDHKPTGLKSVAMTNTPAMLEIEPILNQTPNQEITNMTKEELVELIKETVVAMNSEPTAENECGKKDEAVNEDTTTDAPETETVETTEAESTEAESKTDKVENETAETETEIVEPPVEEVIKEESLNQAPTVAIATDAPWKHLHGEEFFKWCRENGH